MAHQSGENTTGMGKDCPFRKHGGKNPNKIPYSLAKSKVHPKCVRDKGPRTQPLLQDWRVGRRSSRSAVVEIGRLLSQPRRRASDVSCRITRDMASAHANSFRWLAPKAR